MPSVGEGPVNFSVTTLEERGLRVINVSGEVDAATVPMLQAEFETAAGADGPVIVDLCGTSFMDSSGQFALLVFRQRLLDRDRRLVLCCWPDGAVSMLFRVSGTDKMFETYPSRAAALEAVAANCA
jgi:anti-sigma B factor antagonist